MPLIIAVVVIIVLIVWMRDSKKERFRVSANYEKACRKTNAPLERDVLDSFLKDGMTFNEAYSATQKRMCELGYEPCIPKRAYLGHTNNANSPQGLETSLMADHSTEWYDSAAVKSRRDQIRREGRTPTEEEVYASFPRNNIEYAVELKQNNVKTKAIPVGGSFIFPGLGTVEVVSHDFSHAAFGEGYYNVRVLKTGETTRVKVGDERIRRIENDWHY